MWRSYTQLQKTSWAKSFRVQSLGIGTDRNLKGLMFGGGFTKCGLGGMFRSPFTRPAEASTMRTLKGHFPYIFSTLTPSLIQRKRDMFYIKGN